MRGYKPEDWRIESFGDVDGLRVAVLPVQKGAVNIFFLKSEEKVNLPTDLTAVTFTVLMCNSLRSEQLSSEPLCARVCESVSV